MPITMSPGQPIEQAQLLAAFSRCADGLEVETVIGAATNLLMASIMMAAQSWGVTDAQFEHFAAEMAGKMGATVLAGAIANWNRPPAPDDIEVRVS